jgi:hypothetical protein
LTLTATTDGVRVDESAASGAIGLHIARRVGVLRFSSLGAALFCVMHHCRVCDVLCGRGGSYSQRGAHCRGEAGEATTVSAAAARVEAI